MMKKTINYAISAKWW